MTKQQALAAARRAARALEQARDRRDEAIRRATGAGCSLREIGAVVDLSPTRVNQILRGE